MVSAVVQATGNAPGVEQASVAATFAEATSAGALLVACVLTYRVGGALPTFTVSDNKGNTYAAVSGTRRAVTVGSDAFGGEMFRCPGAAGGAAHQVTATGSVSSFIAVGILEISGAHATAPDDQGNSGTGTSTTPSAGALSLDAAADLVLGAMVHLGGAGATISPGSGYTEQWDGGFLQTQSKAAASGTETPTWMLSSSQQWAAYGASFKAAAAGGLSLPVAMHHLRQQGIA